MIRKIYNRLIHLSGHKNALWIVSAVSFAESSFFPFPPDPLYMGMILADRKNCWRLAFVTTVSSVLGGLLGYYIGYALYESIGTSILSTYGLVDKFQRMKEAFQNNAFWLISLKGLTPIPYKLVSITSGVAKVDLRTFFFASVICRGFRFYLLSALFWYFGPGIRGFIDRNLALVTFGTLAALVLGFYIIHLIF